MWNNKNKGSPCRASSDNSIFQLFCFNTQSFNVDKAKALKAFTNGFDIDAILITEVRTSKGVNTFEKSKTVLKSIPHDQRAGVALLSDNKIQLIYEETGIDDSIICTVEKNGCIFIITVIYLTDRLNAREKQIRFNIVIREINDQALKYENPSVFTVFF